MQLQEVQTLVEFPGGTCLDSCSDSHIYTVACVCHAFAHMNDAASMICKCAQGMVSLMTAHTYTTQISLEYTFTHIFDHITTITLNHGVCLSCQAKSGGDALHEYVHVYCAPHLQSIV